MLAHVVEYLYIFLTACLAVYGFNSLYLTLRYWGVRNQRSPLVPLPTEWPRVTIQLPIYNERHVVGRLLKSVSESSTLATGWRFRYLTTPPTRQGNWRKHWRTGYAAQASIYAIYTARIGLATKPEL